MAEIPLLSNRATAILTIKLGPSIGKIFKLYKETVHIGRVQPASIFILEASISRKHCELKYDDGWMIKDCKSMNGTWLTEQLVPDVYYPLCDKSKIFFGKPDEAKVVLEFENVEDKNNGNIATTPITYLQGNSEGNTPTASKVNLASESSIQQPSLPLNLALSGKVDSQYENSPTLFEGIEVLPSPPSISAPISLKPSSTLTHAQTSANLDLPVGNDQASHPWKRKSQSIEMVSYGVVAKRPNCLASDVADKISTDHGISNGESSRIAQTDVNVGASCSGFRNSRFVCGSSSPTVLEHANSESSLPNKEVPVDLSMSLVSEDLQAFDDDWSFQEEDEIQCVGEVIKCSKDSKVITSDSTVTVPVITIDDDGGTHHQDVPPKEISSVSKLLEEDQSNHFKMTPREEEAMFEMVSDCVPVYYDPVQKFQRAMNEISQSLLTNTEGPSAESAIGDVLNLSSNIDEDRNNPKVSTETHDVAEVYDASAAITVDALKDRIYYLQKDLEKSKLLLESKTKESSLLMDSVNKSKEHNTKLLEDMSEKEKVTKDQLKSLLEDEFSCNICTELFIKPTVLNCSHTFCESCIMRWKAQKNECPVCRVKIRSLTPMRAVDNFVTKTMDYLGEKNVREESVENRKNEKPTTYNLRSTRNTAGRSTVEASRLIPVRIPVSDDPAVVIFSEATDTREMDYVRTYETIRQMQQNGSLSSFISNSDSMDEYQTQDSVSVLYDSDSSDVSGDSQAYYGGYGSCYNCGRTGHWANGCPSRY